jgi:hypothetical protein
MVITNLTDAPPAVLLSRHRVAQRLTELARTRVASVEDVTTALEMVVAHLDVAPFHDDEASAELRRVLRKLAIVALFDAGRLGPTIAEVRHAFDRCVASEESKSGYWRAAG